MLQNKYSGSGIMVFIQNDDQDYVLLLQNIKKSGVVLMEPGGIQEVKLTSQQNALKEMFEECCGGLQAKTLDEDCSVLVNQKYLCYGVYLKIGDLNFFKEILDMNRKLIQTSAQRQRLHSYRECSSFEIIELKELLQNQKYFEKNKIKIAIHARTQEALAEFVKSQRIVNGRVNIPLRNCILDRLNYPNQKELLHMLHKQYTYVIQ